MLLVIPVKRLLIGLLGICAVWVVVFGVVGTILLMAGPVLEKDPDQLVAGAAVITIIVVFVLILTILGWGVFWSYRIWKWCVQGVKRL